jgi:hypothetical protein
MKNAFATAVLTAATLVAASPAQAALPPTPGLAFVNQYSFSGRDTPMSSRATYIGGPLTGNQLDVRVSATGAHEKIVTFEQPSTLMIPGPIETVEKVLFEVVPRLAFELFPSTIPDRPTYQDCDYGFAVATCRVPGECNVAVITRLARDTIVLRQDASAVSGIGGPCRVAIYSERGNDVIDSRDGASTAVVCDGGIDRVMADVGDSVASNCEIVTRS